MGKYNKSHILYMVAVALILVGVTTVEAQRRPEQFRVESAGAPNFSFDYAVFAEPPQNRFMLDIFIRVPFQNLYSIKENQQRVSKYELAVIIRDKNGNQVTGASWEREFDNSSPQQYSKERTSYFLERRWFEVEPAEYKVEVILTDRVSNLKSIHEFEVESSHFRAPMMLSGLIFTQPFDSSDIVNKEDFIRYGKLVPPAASVSFDSEKDTPGFYFELYPQNNMPDIIGVRYEIKESGGSLLLDDTLNVSRTEAVEGAIPVLSNLDISQLSPGNYDFEVIIGDRDLETEYASRSKVFFIDWSLATLVKRDFEYAVDILRYVALPGERDSIRDVEPDQRLEAIKSFWETRDPSPSTPENELKDEYYNRVRYANRNFTGYGRPGYLSDFGRIYITYGKPEEIERHPFEIDSRPYEIWYYYRYHRKFVFVDRNGFGYYELAYPGSGALRMD
ncbi:MAG: GWxTD domain-containing protein [candidate division Zixibacteria bacterium]|nr:GWxTD domain-containing protein [candidate division Zixibacteria bacterium]